LIISTSDAILPVNAEPDPGSIGRQCYAGWTMAW